MSRTRRSTCSTQRVDYNDDKFDQKNQEDFSQCRTDDDVSWFTGAAKQFVEHLWGTRGEDELPDSRLSIFQINLKNFVEKWKVVQDCQKFYATNPTGDYIYFTQSAFEFCQNKQKRKVLDGNLEIFQSFSDESFEIVPGNNCFEGYYGKHGLFQACFNYFERRAPNASAQTNTPEDNDSEFECGSENEEEKEAADLHAGLKATPFPVYDMDKDKELQDAVNNAAKTFTMEEEEEVAAESKEQEEPAQEQLDRPHFQLPGLDIRFLDPPPEAPEDTTLPASDLHHPDDDPSFPDAEEPSDEASVLSEDEDATIQFEA